ncbi:enoyl-CoA hydratase/isomerase family protein [Solimonas terrae]|uniref:Enoyl-CoA hydratase/isomerase family protein n=2 Tax=Solimonas terrae TaxID=1396819 RepID=A0A6M2BN65_9GAMM|nr:enoyl-CoA hydratase/isomerase family protein [Solimonas terrae]
MDKDRDSTVCVRSERGVLHLTLNRPEARNAMNAPMLAEIEHAIDTVRDDRAVRAIVLRGAGGHFCAGGDLKSMMTAGGGDAAANGADPIAAVNRAFGTMLRKVAQAPQLVIAICEGAVLGGGFGLACVSDIAFTHVDAKFGMPETTRGLPPAQIAPFVVERIGLTQARRLCLTGASFRGEQALRLGLVHECFSGEDELQAMLAATLAQLMQCAPLATAVTKQILLEVGRRDMDAVLDDAAQKFAASVRGSEAPEGIAAFLQKRAPRWAGASGLP